jgi:hypothetical protein
VCLPKVKLFYDVGATMNNPQRVILAIYFLALAYCCAWVPWYVQTPSERYGGGYQRDGYAWVWVGTSEHARPEVPVIALRLIATTAIGAACFLLAGVVNKSATRS